LILRTGILLETFELAWSYNVTATEPTFLLLPAF